MLVVDALESLQRFYGLAFDREQLEAIAEALPALQADIEAVQRLPRSRELQPAFRFDPRVPGRIYSPQANAVKLFDDGEVPLPGDDASIAFASVVEQSQWIRARRITSLRLTEIYLERIASLDARLNAFIHVAAESAKAQAREADRESAAGLNRGPLHGIPYTLKDVFDAAGMPTTWGSSLFRDRVADADATIASHLKEAGAILLGKVASAELASGASWFGGMVRNPWNTEEPSGGSSAGSASSVAAGLCSFSIGSDSLGSILNPADRCGVVGLRPTFGRVPVQGAMPLTPTLERIGPLCRRIEDAALVLAVLNAPDPSSANSIDVGFEYDGRQDLRGLKVGYSPKWFEKIGINGFGEVDASDSHLAVVDFLKAQGIDLVEIDLPDLPYMSLLKILYVESAAVFEDLTLSGRDSALVAPWAALWRQARFIPAIDYLQAERFRRTVMNLFDELFDRVDVLLAPTYGNFNLLVATNFTGHPGLSFRIGFTESGTRGLGFGPLDEAAPKRQITTNISMHGRLFEEGKMLALARYLEENFGVWRVQPEF